MGRAQYGLLDRYLFTATLRADGTSRVSEGNNWGLFPSGAIAWRVVDEPFMQSQRLFQELKLRASYGVVGNTSGLRPYLTKGALAQTIYAYGNDPAFGFRPAVLANEELVWESTATLNIGLDFGLFDGRVSGSVEAYRANTNDLIMFRALPYTSGYGAVQQNVGATQNTGIEFSLSTVNFDTPGGFRWTTDLMFNRNVEEITELYGGTEDDIGNEWFIGEPMTVYYDWEKVGIWQTGEDAEAFGQTAGQIKVRDQNEDGKIDGDDRIVLGTDQPDFVGSFTNRFEYKGLDLSVFVFARWGQLVRSLFHDSNNSLFGRYNNLDVDYWTPTNPTNAYPRPNEDQERPLYSSSMSYKDGSFLKIRNITLGYNLPQSLVEKLPISSLRVYASALNPLIYAADPELKNLDPEITRTPVDNEDDDDFGSERQAELQANVPSIRLYTFGINLKF
jgi:TonB-linked SusC/RagA family outer membrane protein